MVKESDEQVQLFSDGPKATYARVAETFEPARLTQARILKEFTKQELADRVGVSAAAIGQFEAGAVSPRVEHFPKFAKELGVPVEFFATGRPLGRLDASNAHFRHLRSTRSKDRAKAATHAEQLWELTYALEKRVAFPEVRLPEIEEGTDPKEAASLLREVWQIGRGPLPHLVATMEANGIIVSLISLTNDAVTRVDAYSTNALARPLVVVTPERAKTVYRHRFTCAHELGHLLLHSNPAPGDRQQEREADEFAAELLTPQTQIEHLLPKSIRLAALEQLSREWGVSVESLVRRMGELRLVSEASIRRAYQRLRGTADLVRPEPLSTYPGEVPTLLRDAIALASQHGFTPADLARELNWPNRLISEVLGDEDRRPRLRVVQ